MFYLAGRRSYTIGISDKDAELSGLLGRMRLDGLANVTVPVPFAESVVLAWQRGAPDPGMTFGILMRIFQVRCVARYSTAMLLLLPWPRQVHLLQPYSLPNFAPSTERKQHVSVSAAGSLPRGRPAALGRCTRHCPLHRVATSPQG